MSGGELGLIAEQLWPGLAAPDYRVVDADDPPSGWLERERYWLVGRTEAPDLVVPSSHTVAARALASYSSLRPLKARLSRLAVAGGLATTLLRPFGSIALASREGCESAELTVMEQFAKFGDDLSALMHVRRTANRKALLQLVDKRGATVGYAKIARNAVMSRGIRNEISVLSALDGGTQRVRVPQLLAHGESAGLPYVVTEPLPARIRAVPPAAVPTLDEMTSLFPVVRWTRPSETDHFQRLRERASSLESVFPLRQELMSLLGEVAQFDRELPIVEWFHGDFAFWNTGRAESFWCWDFEDSARDAVAGLDIVHWHASHRRHQQGAEGLFDSRGIVANAEPALRALGIGHTSAMTAVRRLYIAEIVTRTLEVAAADGWQNVWCTSAQLREIAKDATN